MENTTITLEQLAEKLKGNLWVKGEMKRIYLDKGYNTKKMSTKTYIYQREDGTFGVSCYIDCPSQHQNWIDSQRDEIIESVEEKILNAIEYLNATDVYYCINADNETVDIDGKQYGLNFLSERGDYFYSEEEIIKALGSNTNIKITSMPIADFEKEVERLNEINRIEQEKKRAENEAKKQVESKINEEKKEGETKLLKVSGVITTETDRVKHERFGLGTVKSSNADQTEVLFDNEEFGLKKFITKFVKLEIVTNAD